MTETAERRGLANAIRVGYARISTRAQDHAAQLELLGGADCREIVEEKTISTRRAERPKLTATLNGMKAGDTLVITKPDRVARSVKELLVFLEDELAPRGINLHILTGICAGIHRPNGQTMGDKMLFLVAAMAAEMERDLIQERTLDGLAAARAAGRTGGRPTAVTDDVLAAAQARRARGQSVTQIARELGVGRSTLYRALEDDAPPSGAAADTTTAAAVDHAVDQEHDDDQPAVPVATATSSPSPAREPADIASPPAREADDQPRDANAMPAADGNGGQALTEASGEGLAGHAQPVDQRAPAAPVAELYLARLAGEDALLLADGARAGWLHAAPDGWQVHDARGRLVTTLPTDDTHGHGVVVGLDLARRAAAALGIAGAERAAVTVGPLTDDRGRAVDTSPASLASWSLLKGRVPGRVDVIVRGRCVGWLQRDEGGRDVACTLDGPVPGSASTSRVQAVTALLAALVAPAPLPELDPAARTARRPRARSPRERPICPFTPAQLAAAALADNLPRLADGSYRVHVHDGYDDTELGRVYRSGRRWQALNPDGRVVVHRAASRTEAVDQLLATPGPLFGDPADTVLHDL
ncbi:recombinase family protein [Nonomuraea sp. NPDC049625]|uniref:recombinase family protein n=1 Tax=Nonomuraea sp. NPDC049625 TaxID=3155775 RepID=UPI003443733F